MKAILEPSEPDEPLGIGDLLKMEESENLYRLYGYGLCKGNPPPKMLPAISGAVSAFLVPETFGESRYLEDHPRRYG